jgi:tetratricopeptide repeat protein 8
MMGVSNAELWNNLGLCCFYASQFDTALRCFENAFVTSDDAMQADVWCGGSSSFDEYLPRCFRCVYVHTAHLHMLFSPLDRRRLAAQRHQLATACSHAAVRRYNISHIAVTIGDKQLAYQALKVAISLNRQHAEALNNLAILETMKCNTDIAVAAYKAAQDAAPLMYEPFYNGGLTAFKNGELEKAIPQVERALAIFPEHTQSLELQRSIVGILAMT